MAGSNFLTLSADDVALLQSVIDRVRRQRLPTRADQPGGGDDSFQQMYAVSPPPGGIPARVGLLPGVALCEVYRVVIRANGPALEKVPGLTRHVHNLAEGVIPEGSLLPAVMDKWGSWFVTCCGGDGGGSGGPGSSGSGSGNGGSGPDGGNGGGNGGGGAGTVATSCCPDRLLPTTLYIDLVTTGNTCGDKLATTGLQAVWNSTEEGWWFSHASGGDQVQGYLACCNNAAGECGWGFRGSATCSGLGTVYNCNQMGQNLVCEQASCDPFYAQVRMTASPGLRIIATEVP